MKQKQSIGHLLDAIAWLEQNKIREKGITTSEKPAKRKYVFDQAYSVTHFGLVVDQDGLFLAVNKTSQRLLGWFIGIPWGALMIMETPSPKVLLISKSFNFNDVPNISENKDIPGFAIEIPSHSKVLDILSSKQAIKVGGFRITPDQEMQVVIKNFTPIPVKDLRK